MGAYRPFHWPGSPGSPGCPARDPAVNVVLLRITDSGTIEMTRNCTCPPERFGPGSKPIWDPGDEPTDTGKRER